MALANPDHPAFGRRPTPPAPPALPGPADGGSLLRSALASGESFGLRHLVTAVGGVEALEQLHDRPWPAEPFDTSGIAADDRARVEAVVERIDTCTRFTLDDEYRAIAFDLTRRAAVACPAVFRKGDVTRTAAALAWLAVRGNGGMAHRGSRPSAATLWLFFDVSPCADRGRALARALALSPTEPGWRCPFDDGCDVWLADVRLLHSSTRRQLRRHLEIVLAQVARARDDAPIRDAGDGRLLVRAQPRVPQWALRGATDAGRNVVCVAFDDPGPAPFLLGLSVPDARHLVRLLGDALDAPCRARR